MKNNFRLLQSGAIMAKTVCDIEVGEELFISFGPHYKNVSKKERIDFLNRVFIECECPHCERDIDFYVIINCLIIKNGV